MKGRRTFRGANWALCALACAVVLALGHGYGARYYTAWGDETWLVEVAAHFDRTGVLGAPSFEGSGLRLEEKTYGMPPIYPLLLAGWFRVTGTQDLEIARRLSNLVAAGLIVCLFLLMCRHKRASVLPGVAVLALATDVQFGFCMNWARPDILALAFSCLGLLLYSLAFRGRERLNAAWFVGAMAAVTAGMLTHPVGGAIGFVTLPAHLLLCRRRDLKRGCVWGILVGVPLLGAALWSLYLARDPETFRRQFFEWQTHRKAARFGSLPALVLAAADALLNYGVKASKSKLAIFSTVMLLILLLRVREGRERQGLVLLVLATVTSSLAVKLGREMAYHPLNIPFLYWGFVMVIEDRLPSWRELGETVSPRVRDGVLAWRCSYSVFFAALLALTGLRSARGAAGIVREVTRSSRARGYDRRVLAAAIREAVPAGGIVGLRVAPACEDLLTAAGHFGRIGRLSWGRWGGTRFEDYLLRHEYVVMTHSVLEPRFPGQTINLASAVHGGEEYLTLLARHYEPVRKIEPARGSLTIVYRKRSKWGQPSKIKNSL